MWYLFFEKFCNWQWHKYTALIGTTSNIEFDLRKYISIFSLDNAIVCYRYKQKFEELKNKIRKMQLMVQFVFVRILRLERGDVGVLTVFQLSKFWINIFLRKYKNNNFCNIFMFSYYLLTHSILNMSSLHSFDELLLMEEHGVNG